MDVKIGDENSINNCSYNSFLLFINRYIFNTLALDILLGASNTQWMSRTSAPNMLSVQQREGMFSTVVY